MYDSCSTSKVGTVSLFILVILLDIQWYLIMVLTCISLITNGNDCQRCFRVFACHLFFEEVSKFYAYFFNQACHCILVIGFVGVLYIFWIPGLCQTYVCSKYTLPVCFLPVNFLMLCFKQPKFFILMKLSLPIFSLIIGLFMFYLRNHCLPPKSLRYSPMASSRSLV